MSVFNFLLPKPTLSEQDIKKGLRWLTWEGAASMGFFSITTSGILVAFALVLGANNLHIGILAAIPFIMQIVQIPAILLVDKFRKRKVITILSWFPAQMCWILIALIPVFLSIPNGAAISLLLGILAVRGILAAIHTVSWNGWIRDLVPRATLGSFFSRRQAFATVSAAVFSLGAALFIDLYRSNVSGDETIAFGYTYVILFGAIFLGLASPAIMTKIPEPLMQPVIGEQPTFKQKLMAPFKDTNFRRLLQFLLFWNFALNLAIPFFAVHMLQRLGLPVSGVIGLSILSQLFNIGFLRIWGPFADRFGNKPVLSVGISLYLLVIVGWIFTTLPERYFLTIPLLVLLHIFAGIASAAVSFTVGTIGLKLAPQGEATSYLAGASLATNLGAGLAPLLGGYLADFFSTRQLNLNLTWIDPVSAINVSALSIIGRDFLFGIAFFLGIFTLGMLARIREEGETGREVVLESLYSPMRELSRPMSSVPGFTFLSNFPLGIFRKMQVPGLDIALGVTAFQIAEIARTTALTAIKGRILTEKFTEEMRKNFRQISGRSRKKIQEHGVEVVKHTTRGAVHVVNEESVNLNQLLNQLMKSVIEASTRTGVRPWDSIIGASQGIVQGAVETKLDITEVVQSTLNAVKESSERAGMSEDEALSLASNSVIQAAEAFGPEVIAEVVEAIPDSYLPKEKHEKEPLESHREEEQTNEKNTGKRRI